MLLLLLSQIIQVKCEEGVKVLLEVGYQCCPLCGHLQMLVCDDDEHQLYCRLILVEKHEDHVAGHSSSFRLGDALLTSRRMYQA